jgi:hypothetical protein
MQKNVGKTDKIIRVIAGLVIILLGIIYKSWWGVIGILPVITAAIGWCPLYVPFRICTIKGCSCKSGQQT